MSEAPADVSHLLTTDDVVSPGVGGKCITLCGKIVRVGRSGVIPVEHRLDCECVPRLCLQCVREACEWEVEVES